MQQLAAIEQLAILGPDLQKVSPVPLAILGFAFVRIEYERSIRIDREHSFHCFHVTAKT